MPLDAEEMIQLLLKTNKEQEQTITDLRAIIKDLRSTIANLNETLDELKRKLFGASSEKTKASQPAEETVPEAEPTTIVKEHKRVRKKKFVRADLYETLPVVEVPCDIPEEERICPDCDSKMEHLGYKFVREELRITPARVVRVRYMQETLVCPVCREEDETTILEGKTPTPLLAHSPASPDMVAAVMYQKSFLHLPFYRQSKDWLEISLVCNGLNNLWMPIAAVYVPPAAYNIWVTFITGGVSMVIFFFVFKIIFPEGEAKK